MAVNNEYELIENYIYLYHVDQFIILPSYPDSIQDTLGVSFSRTTPLSRSAPIYSYSSSGPRSMQIGLQLHRDMMSQINYGRSNLKLQLDDDYVDTIIAHIQAAALPSYDAAEKMVNPPIIAIRFGDDIYCKGVVTGNVGVTYQLPILRTNKYASVAINFNIEEIDPYDAEVVMRQGSFRGFDVSLERNLFKGSSSSLSGFSTLNSGSLRA